MNAYEKFGQVLEDHRDYGALDTEPRSVAREMIRWAFKGERRIPQKATQWQIFSSMEGSEAASRKLTEAANELVDHIMSIPLRDIEDEKAKATSEFYIGDWEPWTPIDTFSG